MARRQCAENVLVVVLVPPPFHLPIQIGWIIPGRAEIGLYEIVLEDSGEELYVWRTWPNSSHAAQLRLIGTKDSGDGQQKYLKRRPGTKTSLVSQTITKIH